MLLVRVKPERLCHEMEFELRVLISSKASDQKLRSNTNKNYYMRKIGLS